MSRSRLIKVATERGGALWHGWSISQCWGVVYARHLDEWRVVHLSTGRGFGVRQCLTTGQAERLAQQAAYISDVVTGDFGRVMECRTEAERAALMALFKEPQPAEPAKKRKAG